jgi:hypothetical protein
MEARIRGALVIVLAGGWLLVGFEAANAAAPTDRRETVAAGHVAAEAGPAPVAEVTGPSAGGPARTTRREAAEPAEAVSLLVPGRKVRVYSLSAEKGDDYTEMAGTFLDANDASLRIQDAGRVVTVSRGTIRRIEVAMGQRTDWKWLGIGAGAGAGVGVLAGMVASGCTFTSCPNGRTEEEATRATMQQLAIGMAVGAAIGAAIGHAHPRPSRWTDVPLERVQVGLRPAVGSRGFGLTLALGF